MTKNDVDDAEPVAETLDQVQVPIDKLSGDGAYDKSKCWSSLEDRLIIGIIPPREDAVY